MDALVGTECTGTVVWFDPQKGYGFIKFNEGEAKDIFVHHSGIDKTKSGVDCLCENDEVQFTVSSGTKAREKMQASNVVLIRRDTKGNRRKNNANTSSKERRQQ